MSKNHDCDCAGAGENAGLPDASVQELIGIFVTQALFQLGELPNPITKKTETNLAHAKHTIDMLQVIKDKTSGNLSPEEQKLLDTQLYDLRMRYVRRCG